MPEPVNLRDGFLATARQYPDAIAIALGERHWSYAELDAQARSLAAALLEALGRRPERVGVFGCRTLTAYAGTLASLCAGAAFVPLNPGFPLERAATMAELADLDAIIADASAASLLEGLLARLPHKPLLLLPEMPKSVFLAGTPALWAADLARFAPLRDLPTVSSEAPAYLLFTSGSTGQPKGVPITHANVTAFLRVNQERYQLRPDDRLTQLFDPTFDLSVFDLFMAWGCGASIHPLAPSQLRAAPRFVQKRQITLWFSVPSVARLLITRGLLPPNSLPSLRWSLFCGEALTAETAAAWQQAAPNAILENLYGPTELTIACTVYRWQPERSPAECARGIVPIGAPYPGLRAVIVDANLRPVSPGEVGELCVAGPQTFPGYWRDPEKTAAALFTTTDKQGRQQRFYRTGDLARQQPDGSLVYIGRADQQIKINGYRVELGEIEAALRAAPGVTEAVAVAWPIAAGVAGGIVAFVCGSQADPEALSVRLRERLPFYMQPQTIHRLEAMPLNANGKVDRNALRARLREEGSLG
jgi:amino acid adenylation domain-containing protein